MSARAQATSPSNGLAPLRALALAVVATVAVLLAIGWPSQAFAEGGHPSGQGGPVQQDPRTCKDAPELKDCQPKPCPTDDKSDVVSGRVLETGHKPDDECKPTPRPLPRPLADYQDTCKGVKATVHARKPGSYTLLKWTAAVDGAQHVLTVVLDKGESKTVRVPGEPGLAVLWYRTDGEITDGHKWVKPRNCPKPMPTPSASVSPEPTVSTSPGTGGGDVDELPVTGAGAGTILGAGLVILLTGAGLVLLATRRRARA